MSAYEAIDIYRDRDSIEKLFMIIKSQMDLEKFKVQSDASLRAKFYIAFIASIVRNEIYKASKQLKVTSNKIIDVLFKEVSNSLYIYVEDTKVFSF